MKRLSPSSSLSPISLARILSSIERRFMVAPEQSAPQFFQMKANTAPNKLSQKARRKRARWVGKKL